jgi:hypothetical protein
MANWLRAQAKQLHQVLEEDYIENQRSVLNRRLPSLEDVSSQDFLIHSSV